MITRRCLVAVTSAAVAIGGLVAAPDASAAPATLYVSTDGTDTNACTTKADPCRTIAHAVQRAAATATIHVAKGDYPAIGSPGSKHITVIGAGSNIDSQTHTSIAPSNVIDATVDNADGVLDLRSMILISDWIGITVERGRLTTSHVSFQYTTCPLYITGGRVAVNDSVIDVSGAAAEGSNDCAPTATSPAAVTLDGGSLSFTRSKLTDTEREPGIVVNGGRFSAVGSEFSNANSRNVTPDPALRVSGGAATISRSLFTKTYSAIESPGGATTITDSTFYDDDVALSAAMPGSQQLALRSTFIDAEVFGPVRLGGDVLVNHGGDPACDQEPEDLGYNYGTQGGCTFSAPTSHGGAATLNLDPNGLGKHGGPTRTVAQSRPSALIDAIPTNARWGPDGGKPFCAPGTTDQRGLGRPKGHACDAGAFEVGPSRTTLTVTPDPTAPGTAVMLKAKVSAALGAVSNPDQPTGKVTFKVANTTLCSARPVSASGIATCSTTKLPAGRVTVTAAFTSTSPYLNSSATAHPVIGTIARFTTANTAHATIGQRRTITIRATGTPSPTISKVSGALPGGLHFTGGRGSATITGTPARGSAGKYVLHLKATNVRGSTPQTFTLTVVPS